MNPKEELGIEWAYLNREAQLAGELLGSGATLIRKACSSHTGLYHHAFFNLSNGFERAGKLIYIADYAIDNKGRYPSNDALKKQLGHDLDRLFVLIETICGKRCDQEEFSSRPRGKIYDAIYECLQNYSQKSGRFYNLDFVTNAEKCAPLEPIQAWYEKVGGAILEDHYTPKKRQKHNRESDKAQRLFGQHAVVIKYAEDGRLIDNVKDMKMHAFETEIIQRWSQFYTLQIIRWISTVLSKLSVEGAYHHRIGGLMGWNEAFSMFRNPDDYLKSRKTWSIY